MAKTPTDTESSPKRRGRPPKASGALPKAEVQSAYRARLKTSGKALKWVEANFDACEQRALLARQQDDLVNALAMLEIRQQEIARLKARVGELERSISATTASSGETAKDQTGRHAINRIGLNRFAVIL